MESRAKLASQAPPVFVALTVIKVTRDLLAKTAKWALSVFPAWLVSQAHPALLAHLDLREHLVPMERRAIWAGVALQAPRAAEARMV